MKVSISLIALTLLLGSCAFNNMFLQPTTYNQEQTQTKLIIQNDTVTVAFQDENHQPYYIKKGNDTVSFNYTIESVLFDSESGNQLNGWWLIPKDVEPKITLIHFHGNAGSLPMQHFATTKMLEYGFQTFAIDYSGFGFSTGKAKRKSVIKDGNSAIDYVLKDPRVKGTKVVIYGQSLGGNLAGSLSSLRSDDIDAVVIEGGFSSHKDIAANVAGFIGRWFVKEQYSSKSSVSNFHKPILIIHSNEDDVIPISQGKLVFEQANSPKEFYEIDGCHICGSRIYAKEISEKIFNMLENK
ncbi:MAG: alpha/beta hydrolase [Brumimicrobium sp.]|nr:alpha/beta hydrolase [Brumimicrobium sp.]